jgi:hypothetical protein
MADRKEIDPDNEGSETRIRFTEHWIFGIDRRPDNLRGSMRHSTPIAMLELRYPSPGAPVPWVTKGKRAIKAPPDPPVNREMRARTERQARTAKDGLPGKDGTAGIRIVRSSLTQTGEPVSAVCDPQEVMISARCTSGGSYHGSVVTLGDGSAMCPDFGGSPPPCGDCLRETITVVSGLLIWVEKSAPLGFPLIRACRSR